MGGVVCGFWGFFFPPQLKYACNIRRPLPQQSIQKATKVKAVNTEKHSSEGQLKNKNKYQEITHSHYLVSSKTKVQKLKIV